MSKKIRCKVFSVIEAYDFKKLMLEIMIKNNDQEGVTLARKKTELN